MSPKHPKHPPIPAHAANARVAGHPPLLAAEQLAAPAAARASKPAVAVRADLRPGGMQDQALPAAPVARGAAPHR